MVKRGGGADNLVDSNKTSSVGDGDGDGDGDTQKVNELIKVEAYRPTVNVSVDGAKFVLPVEGINNAVAVSSSIRGMALGLKELHMVNGPPSVKLAAGVATVATTQVVTAVMSKVLNATSK